MKFVRSLFASLLIAAAASLGGAGLASAQNYGAQSYGPANGAQAPAVSGQDQSGTQRDLEGLMGENGLVLAFNRSADWCSYCQRQLIDLEQIRPQIEQRGWALAAVTTDNVEELARFAERRRIGFPMISDEPGALVRAYDLLDPAMRPSRRHNGLPIPTIFFITPDGIIAARLGHQDYRERPEPEQVIATIDRIGD